MLDRYFMDDDSDTLEFPYAVRVALYYDQQELDSNSFNGYTRKDFTGTLSTVGNSVYLTNTSSINWINTGSTAWPERVNQAKLWIHYINANGLDIERRLISTGILPEGSTIGNLEPGEYISIGKGALTLEWL